MKNFKLKRLLGLALIGGLTTLNASTVFAAAGDTISNTATLNFDVGGVAQTAVVSPAADFVEDRKINFTVAESGGVTTSVTPNATLQVQTFTVTNNSNSTQDFLLTARQVSGPFTPTAVQVRVDSALTTVLPTTDVFNDIATDSAIFIDELAAGASRTVYILATIPGTATNGQVAVMSLVAQVAAGGAAGEGAAIMNDNNGHASPAGVFSNTGTTTVATLAAALTAANIADNIATVQTVFADAAGTLNSAGAADVASNGQHSDNDSYTVSAAALSVAKSVVVLWDPINGGTNPKAIPGAYMQYTVTVSNAGPASAILTTLSDALQAAVGSLDLDPNLILATATTPVPAALVGTDIENALGDAVRIDAGGTSRPLAATLTYCTGDVADADADGCSYSGGAGGTLSITFSDPIALNPNVTGMAAEVGYLEGELLSGESVDIVFNAIVQ